MAESMRAGWGAPQNQVALSTAELTALIQPAFPGDSVVSSAPSTGGLANTNIRLDLVTHPEPVLLRIYSRDPNVDVAPMPDVAAKEAMLLRLLESKLTVPQLYFAAAENPVTGHAYMLREWVEGERLEVVAHQLSRDALRHLAEDVGATSAAIHTTTFASEGYLDGDLNVVPFPPSIGGPLPVFLDTLMGTQGRQRLGPELTQRLMAFAQTESNAGASWSGLPCLCHGDFGGSNILVRMGEQARVAAVIDWEYALSGSPFMDLANVLRPPLGELPGFEAGVARGYRAAGGELPDDWRRRILMMVLIDWAAFLGRSNITDALIDDARRMIARSLEKIQAAEWSTG